MTTNQPPEGLDPRLRRLFDAQLLAVLATDAGQGPYTSLVAFAASDDLGEVVFATRRDTRKFANLTSNARVSLLIDSRINHLDDFHAAVACTLLGEAHEVPAGTRDRLLAIYLAKHPTLREFVSRPECALVVVRVTGCSLVGRFQPDDADRARMAAAVATAR